jgi:protein involved in polysaccharide export with SLBB domain
MQPCAGQSRQLPDGGRLNLDRIDLRENQMQRALFLTVLIAAVLLPPAVSAQQVGSRLDSRAQLESRRDSLESQLLQLGGESDQTLDIERQIAGIDQRLLQGDFRAGEVVGLEVRGQPQWSGSFTVQPDQTLVLPGVPPIDMNNVLYSEAEEVIHAGLSTVLRDPQVEIDTQMRVGVVGEVTAPGYYDVSGSMLVSDVLMLAGGPTNRAATEKIRVRRFGETVLQGPELTAPGLTLDDLGIRPGDSIEMPSTEGKYLLLRNIGIALGIVLSSAALIALIF